MSEYLWRVAAAGLALAAAEALAIDDAAPTVDALWNEQEIYFTYSGFTSYYSCDGLEDKVRYLLKELGAREGYKVRSAGCSQSNGPENFPRVRIQVATAVEATPARLEALAKEQGRRELIARVNKERAGAMEATQQFSARPRQVEFKDRTSGRIQAGDCELVERFADEVLPKLGIRVVERDLRCMPRQVSAGSVRLVVEVLEPVPLPEESVTADR